MGRGGLCVKLHCSILIMSYFLIFRIAGRFLLLTVSNMDSFGFTFIVYNDIFHYA